LNFSTKKKKNEQGEDDGVRWGERKKKKGINL
jgi:hypothetical protein